MMSQVPETCNGNCGSCSADCASRKAGPGSMREKPNPASSVKKVIGVVSGKGGVGKSFVAGMLAVLLNRRGYHTAVLDADITGPSIPKMFGIHEKATGDEKGLCPVSTGTGIDVMSINLLLDEESAPVVWRGPLIAGAVRQFWTDVVWKDVDFLFVDMPPGTGDVPLTVFQSIPVDGIVVVTSPQELVSMIVSKAVGMAEMMSVPILGIVENMSWVRCPGCGRKISVFGESHADSVAEKYGLKVLSRLPIDPEAARACDRGEAEKVSAEWLSAAADAVEHA